MPGGCLGCLPSTVGRDICCASPTPGLKNNQLMEKSRSLPVMRVTNLNSTQPKGFYRVETVEKKQQQQQQQEALFICDFPRFKPFSHFNCLWRIFYDVPMISQL